MPRSTNSPASRHRRKKTLKAAKGFWGRRKNLFCTAKDAVLRSNVYAYRDRRQRKRDFRRLWITRISAAAKAEGISYNRFMWGLKQAGVDLDRKVLADLAVEDPSGFNKLVEIAKAN
jgi:large subunit ribosomal protein L20